MKRMSILWLCLVLTALMAGSCSSDDQNLSISGGHDSGTSQTGRTPSGYVWCPVLGDSIPILLTSLGQLPEWLQDEVSRWGEWELMNKVFKGKRNEETVYYIYNPYINCGGCTFYDYDGTNLDIVAIYGEDYTTWGHNLMDWQCIYAASPIKEIKGQMHCTAAEVEKFYIASNNKRYYIWGNLQYKVDFKKLDGRQVIVKGFFLGENTVTGSDVPKGISCYAIDAIEVDGI